LASGVSGRRMLPSDCRTIAERAAFASDRAGSAPCCSPRSPTPGASSGADAINPDAGWHMLCTICFAQRCEFPQPGDKRMNATALLKTQHRKLEVLFKKLEGGRSAPQAVLDELANSLAAH